MTEEEISEYIEKRDLLIKAQNEAMKASCNAEGERTRLMKEFATKHSKYKVGQRVYMCKTNNVGSLYRPKWKKELVEVEVASVSVFISGSTVKMPCFYYKLMNVKKSGEVSSHKFGSSINETEVDHWNTVHRCGWCGNVTNHQGDPLENEERRIAIEICEGKLDFETNQVNGICCPNGN